MPHQTNQNEVSPNNLLLQPIKTANRQLPVENKEIIKTHLCEAHLLEG